MFLFHITKFLWPSDHKIRLCNPKDEFSLLRTHAVSTIIHSSFDNAFNFRYSTSKNFVTEEAISDEITYHVTVELSVSATWHRNVLCRLSSEFDVANESVRRNDRVPFFIAGGAGRQFSHRCGITSEHQQPCVSLLGSCVNCNARATRGSRDSLISAAVSGQSISATSERRR